MLLEMRVFAITIDPFTNAPIVILKDLEEENTLPVWIGVLEAGAIASEVEKIQFSRPMTHDLFTNIFKSTSMSLDRVEITDIIENVYYARLLVVSKEKVTYTIDARPSDAIAIALRMEAPIYVDTIVLDKSRDIDVGAVRGKMGERVEGANESEDLDILEDLSPEDFGKYKM
ncbi:MAG: bifunctional nuclease family protein [Thermodesulfobacteriota bacterium]